MKMHHAALVVCLGLGLARASLGRPEALSATNKCAFMAALQSVHA